MSFVTTGFPVLDSMLSSGNDCRGFPRGALTLLSGATGSGETQVLRKCCERAHKKGLKVVYFTTEEEFRSEYPVREVTSLEDVTRRVANLLHPGKRDKTDLLVLDSLTHMTPDFSRAEIAGHARQLEGMLQLDFGQTAVVGTYQSRRLGPGLTSSSSTHQRSNIALEISKIGQNYRLDLVKSRYGVAGVSCEIRPIDMEDYDRSKIPTRYERILRGRD
jgi:hypothetical protein